MMPAPDIVCDAYGIRPGDRVGILMHDDVERRQLIDTLDRLLCEYVILDPLRDAIDLSSVVVETGIRLVLTSQPVREIASRLPACIACAKFLIDSSIHCKNEPDCI